MKDKNILITGGTTGIGLATAQLLIAEGAKVIVTGRNPKTLEEARGKIPEAIVLASDSGSVEAAQALGQAVQQHVNRLDGVFLNAGIGEFGPIDAMSPDHYERMFGINVRGPYFQLQSLLSLLANPSSVLLNASVVAQLGMPTTSIYAATKAAVVSLGKTLAAELAPRGIRVNTISPGPISTPIYGKLGMPPEMLDGFEKSMAEKSLLKRFGTSGEVAKVARLLLSEDAAYVTGVDLLVDGGIRLA